MQQFFNDTTDSTSTVPLNPGWDYVHAGLSRNLATVLRYYRTRPFSVKSQHILVRMLNTLGAPYSASLERFYDIVDAKSLNIGMGMKMTSSLNKGVLHEGLFYGPECKEIIIATNDGFSPFQVHNNWRSVSAVTVLQHPRSDLDMILPTGRSTGTERGLAVIAVNIPMLAIQYRAFMENEMNRKEEGHSPLTTAQFVHMYVLPNMMPSHLDCSLFNRAYNIATGAPMGESTVRHRFALIDYHQRVDKVYAELTSNIEKSDKPYFTIMDSFPCVGHATFRELFRLPDQAPTRQLAWAEVATRVKAIHWLTMASPYAGKRLNRGDNNYFIKEFLQHRNDRSLETMPADERYWYVQSYIKDIVRNVVESESGPWRLLMAI